MRENKRVALVTGAGKRIGKAVAQNLAQAGWAVAVHFNESGTEAQEVVNSILEAGGAAIAVQGDLSDPKAVDQIVPQTCERLGAPTCLINNASLFEGDALGSLDRELWDKHLGINVQAPVFLAQAMSNQLPQDAEGNVINIIDQRVWKLTPLFFSYTISKSALWTATRTLAQALAPRIRVNAIGPGPALQSIHQTDDQFREQSEATPLIRGTTPEEIANAINFILDAPAMTGQMIALDGGQHLAWQTADVAHDA